MCTHQSAAVKDAQAASAGRCAGGSAAAVASSSAPASSTAAAARACAGARRLTVTVHVAVPTSSSPRCHVADVPVTFWISHEPVSNTTACWNECAPCVL